jgi:hypothetical protein
VRSHGTAGPGARGVRDLIEAGLNEAAGWLGAMGIAPLMSWRRTRERGLEACAEDGLDGSRFVDQALHAVAALIHGAGRCGDRTHGG